MKFASFCSLFFLLFISFASVAQLRYTKLVIEQGQVFSYAQSDILVADTLIMRDSSSIVLNHLKKENYLYAKVAIIGKGCSIKGDADHGKQGTAGRVGSSSAAPCKSATNGEDAQPGSHGGHATRLLIYIKDIQINNPILISLSGGNGGHGGKGGDGGSAGAGTIHCKGGDGGHGGKGGQGANGGNGGVLVLNLPLSEQTKLKQQLRVFLKAGNYGRGGRGGYSGSGGLGPRGKDGRNGLQGEDGIDGVPGAEGTITYLEY
jgi:hypothetical protein